MPSKATFTLIDHSGESSSTTICMPDLTPGNLTTIVDDTNPGGYVRELRVAMNGVTLMNHVRRTVQATIFPDTGALPTNVNAQREQKLLVSYSDDVTAKRYSFEIPGADRAALAQTGTDVVDHTAGAAASLVTALETYAVSPDGNAITVLGMRLVGRNL